MLGTTNDHDINLRLLLLLLLLCCLLSSPSVQLSLGTITLWSSPPTSNSHDPKVNRPAPRA